jgi:hypothetical protein
VVESKVGDAEAADERGDVAAGDDVVEDRLWREGGGWWVVGWVEG